MTSTTCWHWPVGPAAGQGSPSVEMRTQRGSPTVLRWGPVWKSYSVEMRHSDRPPELGMHDWRWLPASELPLRSPLFISPTLSVAARTNESHSLHVVWRGEVWGRTSVQSSCNSRLVVGVVLVGVVTVVVAEVIVIVVVQVVVVLAVTVVVAIVVVLVGVVTVVVAEWYW